ncbi:hypothetical protein BZA77DRAFT_312907 [Pyronema omphalodes]|nr:hypothetical protein BZA77DRAFT_312907 [Pyronema omphalodes]
MNTPASSSQSTCRSVVMSSPNSDSNLFTAGRQSKSRRNNDAAKNDSRNRQDGSLKYTSRSFTSTRSLRLGSSTLSLVLLVMVSLILGVSAGNVHKNRDVDWGRDDLAKPVEILVDTSSIIRRSTTPGADPTTEEEGSSADQNSKSDNSKSNSKSNTNTTAATAVPQFTVLDSVSTIVNLTQSCSVFMSKVRANAEFQGCKPLSGMIRDSTKFWDIVQSGLFETTRAMDKICKTDFQRCSTVMDNLSGQVKLPENCGEDFKQGNPVVHNLWTLLISYKPIQLAGCDVDETGTYCYAAAAYSDEPSDIYIYSLPLGNVLPTSYRPSCNKCVKSAANNYRTYAGNITNPLYETFPRTVDQINTVCGPNFASKDGIKYTGSSAASSISTISATPLLAISALTALFALLA